MEPQAAEVLVRTDGPAKVVLRLRPRAGSGQLGELMDCFYCLSLWVAAPFGLALAHRRRQAPLLCLALSAAACLLEQATRECPPATVVAEQAPVDLQT